MAHKSRPPPLKDLQIAVQPDQSRRYLVLDANASLPSPHYPFGLSTLRQRALVSPYLQADADDYRWHDSLDSQDGNPVRSFTLPISPPSSSPRGRDTPYSSKRSASTFALVPSQVDGNHVFTHVVVNPEDDHSKQDPVSPQQVGLPKDMQDILRQLDDLASWVKTASSSRDYGVTSIVHATRPPEQRPGDALFPDKGKNRLLSSSPPAECDSRRDFVDPSSGAVPGNSIQISPAISCQSEGFIYVPDCNTPEFLVGSSSSPIAYPVCGYSSHPSRHCPHPPDTTHDIPYHPRSLERRSAPYPPLTSPLISPPSAKTSFKALFQRSRCNTTAAVRPSIPSGHVPVENVLRQGKRMRLPWLRI